jgi:alanine racemase
VHIKVNTGMNRFGVHWTKAVDLADAILRSPSLFLEGVQSHFAQSDELEKTFANLQISRFRQVLAELDARGIRVPIRHLCNSGGFLDLPHAHFDMVRVGILPLGVFPSAVCRRLEGVRPIMSVKAQVVAIQDLRAGDTVGYGMRYTAQGPRRIAVLPIGYGDGFPRVRNQGWTLIRGQRAPLVGGVAMDAITVDITDIPGVELWDEAVIMGEQGLERITAQDVAQLKGTVTYDVLTNWRGRLPKVYLGRQDASRE